MGLRDQILNSVDIKEEIIDVPEWSCKVLVKGLTSTARDDFERKLEDPTDEDKTAHLKNITARLLAVTLCDPSTKQLIFTDPKDISRLGTKNADVTRRLFRKAKELSGMLDDDAKAMDKEVKK